MPRLRPPAPHAPAALTSSLALALALAAGNAAAAPPTVSGVTPLGARKGTATLVTFKGSNLVGNPRLVAPFGFTLAAPAPAGSDASNWKANLVVDPAAPVGVHVVRLQTDDGLSPPFLLAVGQLPQVAEAEDNSTFETAQKFEAPAVVEGQAAGNDVDYFRFAGKKGQRVVVDAQCARVGSGVDPSIRLTTADRKFVASADDSPGLLTDARLFAVLPADTDYVIELSDSRYQGGGKPVYRLVVGELPAAEEVFPLGGRRGETVGLELRGGTIDGVGIAAATLNAAPGAGTAAVRVTSGMLGRPGPAYEVESLGPLAAGEFPETREPADASAPPPRGALPVVFNGRIDPEGDEDRFVVAVTPGQKVRVEVEAAESGSNLDGVLQVLNPTGGVITTADDTTTNGGRRNQAQQQPIVSPDPSAEFTIPTGVTEITLALRDLESRGGVGYPYRITVTPAGPGFDVTLNDGQVSIPKGGSAAVPVTVVRKGFNGPITLKVLDPPPGLTVRPGTVADGQLLGTFTVSAAADATFPVSMLKVVGEATGPNGPLVATAVKSTVFAQQATLPTNTQFQTGLAAATALPAPLALETPAAPVEVAHGYSAPVPVKAVRPKGAEGALALTALPLPPGLTAAAATIKEKDAEAPVTVTTTTDHPVGTVTIVLQAKGKIAGADRTLVVPAVTLNVVRPAAVEVAAPAVELKAGATAEVKGKVVRKGGFKEPVTVKLNGLPAGVKADPVTVPPDKSEFTVKLTAEPKAAAATAGASVALAFQVNKKDYPAVTAPLSVKVVKAP